MLSLRHLSLKRGQFLGSILPGGNNFDKVSSFSRLIATNCVYSRNNCDFAKLSQSTNCRSDWNIRLTELSISTMTHLTNIGSKNSNKLDLFTFFFHLMVILNLISIFEKFIVLRTIVEFYEWHASGCVTLQCIRSYWRRLSA